MHSFTLKGQSGGYRGIIGIFVAHSRQVLIDKNFMHSFQSESEFPPIAGIITQNYSGTGWSKYSIQNNMIRLGIDTAGNLINNNNDIQGIMAQLDSIVITHNSVYIGGTGDGRSSCLNVPESDFDWPGRVTNNIFVNARTGPGFWGRTLIYDFDLDISNLSMVTFRNNLFQLANGNGNYTSYFYNQYYSTLTDWKIASGADQFTLAANPLFINPLGNINAVNLHLSTSSPAEGAGVLEASVTHDFDNETRSAYTPVDIGADAGNFLCAPPAPPTISSSPAGSFCTGTPVTLTANAGGCSSCTYSWNGGAATSNPSLTVTSSGNYQVTISNSCGSSSAVVLPYN
jgi:hypothetical protein